MGFNRSSRERHLDILARLMLTTSLLITYAYGLEIFMPFYRGEAHEVRKRHVRT